MGNPYLSGETPSFKGGPPPLAQRRIAELSTSHGLHPSLAHRSEQPCESKTHGHFRVPRTSLGEETTSGRPDVRDAPEQRGGTLRLVCLVCLARLGVVGVGPSPFGQPLVGPLHGPSAPNPGCAVGVRGRSCAPAGLLGMGRGGETRKELENSEMSCRTFSVTSSGLVVVALFKACS